MQEKNITKAKQKLIDLIKIEISWYSEHSAYKKDFQDGFIYGLRRMIMLIRHSE